MQQLEPTYLRYVYDGLSKGSISSNNPTSLPIGFIGLFEDEFPSSIPLVERMSILNRLATWALLKGPVSIEMVAEVLNEHPDKTKALIDTYSKWFNSPEPGKYVLYHDRLRTYLLQKLSNHEVQDLNETLISYLENALNSEDLKEAESYALEHLSTHMLVESQMGNNYERLHEFVNQEDLWKRQITTSEEYKWSQRSVQYGIKEGARRHDEKKTIESTSNSVKLSQNEENDIDQIINLLNLGNYEIALKRCEFFKGNKQINIYLLMIHELTTGKSKDSKFKNKACNLIISLIKNEKISIKNYSLYAIYHYEFELFKIGIDDFCLIKKFSLGGNVVQNELKTVLIRLLEHPKLDYNFHDTLVNKCLYEIDKIDLYILRASKLFKQKQSETALKNLDIAINYLKKLNFSSFPHSYMAYGMEASDEKYYISYIGYQVEWYLNISELYGINNYKELSLKYLKDALAKINIINLELVQKSNSAQLKKGLNGDDKIQEFNIYKYHSRLSKLYLLNDDFDKLYELTKYKSSVEFLTFVDDDLWFELESIKGISYLYKYEIQGIVKALKNKGEEYFNEIYNSVIGDGDNYKFIRCLMLLEKLFFTHEISNNKKIKEYINVLLDLIQGFPNNTFRLKIYYEAYNLLFKINKSDTALKLLEESYSEISGIWSNGENLKKFFSIVQIYTLEVYQALYNYVDKKRAKELLDFVIEKTVNHEDYKTKSYIFNYLIETLVKIRNKSRLINFLDFLINLPDQYSYSSSLKKHVLLLIQENFYDEAVFFVKKYNINIDNEAEKFYDVVYPINWDTHHHIEIEKECIVSQEIKIDEYNKRAYELHDFFELNELKSFHDKKTKILRKDKLLNRLFFSTESLKFTDEVRKLFFPSEQVKLDGETYMKKSLVDNGPLIHNDYHLTLEEIIYYNLIQNYNIDDSLKLMECFNFECNSDFSRYGLESSNKFEKSSHFRQIISNTYKAKLKRSFFEKSKEKTKYIFNKLTNFIDSTDFGKGAARPFGRYNFNFDMCHDFTLFFSETDKKNYSLEFLDRCVNYKDITDFHETYLNIHEKYSSKEFYKEKIIKTFDKIIAIQDQIIVEGSRTPMEIDLNILLRLNKLGEKKIIDSYKNRLLNITQKTKFSASDDKENFIAELSELYCKIGDFKTAEVIYNLLSEDYLISITSRAPDIEQLKIEYLLKHNMFEEFKVLYLKKLDFFDDLITNDLVNVYKLNKFFSGFRAILKLLNINNSKTYKNILISYKDRCNKFIYKYQNDTKNNFSVNLRLDDFVYLFDSFILIGEDNLAQESLKDLLRLTSTRKDVFEIIKKSNSDYHIIIETLNNIDSENKKTLEVIKQLKKEINEKDKTNYQKYFSNLNDFDNKSYELLSREKNLDYDCLSQLLIHYSKVQIFYNDNPKALNDVSEIIDIHEWLDIKSKINKLQLSN